MTRLTDERIDSLIERHVGGHEITDDEYSSMARFARAIEAELSKQEPVAWQERQRLSYNGAWTNWYECSHRPIDAPRQSLLGGEGGIPIEWRPLYTAPPPSAPDTVQVPREPTQDMLYAMAELDGWKRGDREHPMLTRWEDYWVAALAAAPK